MSAKNKCWYVVIAKHGQIKKIGSRLNELGIENIVPMQKQVRQWCDRKKIMEVPLFFDYAFVKCKYCERNRVFEADGIKCFLSIGGILSKVSESEIQRIRKLLNYDKEIEIEPYYVNMQKGVKVLITDGCMKGLTGELCSDLKVNSKRVKINIDSIKSFACVEIPRGYLSLCG